MLKGAVLRLVLDAFDEAKARKKPTSKMMGPKDQSFLAPLFVQKIVWDILRIKKKVTLRILEGFFWGEKHTKGHKGVEETKKPLH